MKLTQIKPNLTRIDLNARIVWFSYETPIAFFEPINQEVIMSENVWTRTTGRHLNVIEHTVFFDVRKVHHDTFSSMLNDYI
jgi:hypothetical protein